MIRTPSCNRVRGLPAPYGPSLVGLRTSRWARPLIVMGCVAVVLSYAAPPIAMAAAQGDRAPGLPGLDAPSLAFPSFEEPDPREPAAAAVPAAAEGPEAAERSGPPVRDGGPPASARPVPGGAPNAAPPPAPEVVVNAYGTGSSASSRPARDPFAGAPVVEDIRGALPTTSEGDTKQGHAQTADPADAGAISPPAQPTAGTIAGADSTNGETSYARGRSDSAPRRANARVAEVRAATLAEEPAPAAATAPEAAAAATPDAGSEATVATTAAAAEEPASGAPAADDGAGATESAGAATGAPEAADATVSAGPESAPVADGGEQPATTQAAPLTLAAPTQEITRPTVEALDAPAIASLQASQPQIASDAASSTAVAKQPLSDDLLSVSAQTLAGADLAAATAPAMTASGEDTTSAGAPAPAAPIDADALDGGAEADPMTIDVVADEGPGAPSAVLGAAPVAAIAPAPTAAGGDDEPDGDVESGGPPPDDPGSTSTLGTASEPLLASTDGDTALARGPPAPEPWIIDLTDPSARVVSLGVDGTDLVLTVNGITSTRALALITSVHISAGSRDDSFAIDLPGEALPFVVTIDGGDGTDTILGPTSDTTWSITGAGAGSVAGVSFTGIEQLTGAADNEDTFVFGPGAEVTGLVDGGSGGFDTIELAPGSTTSLGYTPSGPDSGDIHLNGTTIAFAGLEPVVMTGTAEDIVVTFTDPDAIVRLEMTSTGGLALISDLNEDLFFPIPTRSLTIHMFLPGSKLPGANLTISEVDLGTARLSVQNATELIVAGNVRVQGEVGDDGIRLVARSLLKVDDGVTMDAGNADIELDVNASTEIEWSAAVPQFQDLEAHGRLEVGAGAKLLARNITVTVDSKVKQLGLFEIDQLLLGQVAGTVLTALLSEGTPVTFVPVVDPPIGASAPDMIVRANGSWAIEGFMPDTWIHVAGTLLNDGFYRVIEVAPNGFTLYLDPELGDRFVLPEVALSDNIEIEEVVVGQSLQGAPQVLDLGVTLSFSGNAIERHDARDWAQDGFRVGQSLIVTDTPGGANDGSYEIIAVNGQILDVNAGGRLVSQPMVTDAIVYASGSPGDLPLAVRDPNVRMTQLEVPLRFAGSTITRLDGGAWANDGFAANQLVLVTGATANAGTFEVTSVAGSVLTISRPAFVAEDVASGVDVATVAVAQAGGALDDLQFEFDRETATIRRLDPKTWSDDGFAPNQRIQVIGTTSNDGTYLVATLSGDVLQLAAGSVVVDETTVTDPLADPEPAPAEIVAILISLIRPELVFDDAAMTITRSAGSWTQDGFAAGDRIVVDGTLHNDGHYVIAQISSDERELTLEQTTPVQAAEVTRTADVTKLRPYEEVDPNPNDAFPLTVRDVTDALILPVARLTSPLQGFLAQAVTQSATAELVIRAGALLEAPDEIVVRSVATSKLLLETEGLYLGITLRRVDRDRDRRRRSRRPAACRLRTAITSATWRCAPASSTTSRSHRTLRRSARRPPAGSSPARSSRRPSARRTRSRG